MTIGSYFFIVRGVKFYWLMINGVTKVQVPFLSHPTAIFSKTNFNFVCLSMYPLYFKVRQSIPLCLPTAQLSIGDSPIGRILVPPSVFAGLYQVCPEGWSSIHSGQLQGIHSAQLNASDPQSCGPNVRTFFRIVLQNCSAFTTLSYPSQRGLSVRVRQEIKYVQGPAWQNGGVVRVARVVWSVFVCVERVRGAGRFYYSPYLWIVQWARPHSVLF